jgi:flagellar basal body-associated protein FliL
MNKLLLVLIVILLGLVGASTYGYVHLTQKLSEAEEIAEREKELREIKVKKSSLSGVTEFIFARVSNQYMYFYDKKLGKVVKDHVQRLYEWDYEFSFGIKVPENWDWCISVVEDKPGYLQINSPKPSLISKNDPNPKIKKVIKSSSKKHEKTVDDAVNKLVKDRIKKDANTYLKEKNVIKNITLSFSKHIQDIINSTHQSSNPVAGVDINYVDKSVCK